MRFNLVPIDSLIDESIRLSSNPAMNKGRLEKIRELIIKQKQIIDKYNYKELKKKMEDYNTPSDEYYEYLELYEVFKQYEEKSDIISLIENRKYTKLNNINNRRLKKYKIAGGVAAGVLVAALGTNILINKNKEKPTETTTEITNDYNNYKEAEKIKEPEVIKEKSTEKVIDYLDDVSEKNYDEEEITETIIEESNISEAEQRTVVDLFKDMNDDTLNGDGSKEAKSRAKGFIVNTIDFVFFNSSINGITFNDLKDEFKQEVYGYLRNMDNVIMSFDPDYKESLGEKYNAVKNYAKEKLDTAKSIVINHLGEDRYNAIISKKNEIMDSIKEGFKKYGGKALKWLKDKYTDWKEN